MKFVERYIPARHRSVVDAFKRAIAESCANAALAPTTVEMTSDGDQDFVVITLNDPLGGRTAVIDCPASSAPKYIGRRVYREAARLLHGKAPRPAGRVRSATAGGGGEPAHL